MNLVVALSIDGFIGTNDNKLPWYLPDDLKFFKSITLGKKVVMGRKTWESIPKKFRPLPGRMNIIISRSLTSTALCLDNNVLLLNNPEGLIELKDVFVIGGAQIYKMFLPFVNTIYITHVNVNIGFGIRFPEFDLSKWKQEIIMTHPADEKHKYSFKTIRYTKNPKM